MQQFKIFEAISGAITSFLLVYIAYQNYKISAANNKIQKNKFRLDLLDRRYKSFNAVRVLLKTFVVDMSFTRQNLYNFSNETSDADFLFGPEVTNYIDEIKKKTLQLIHLDDRLKKQNPDQQTREKIANEMAELEGWFLNQVQDYRNIFRKYLKFTIGK